MGKNFAKQEFPRKKLKDTKIIEVYLKAENPLVVLPITKTFPQWIDWLNSKGINPSAKELYKIGIDGGDFYPYEIEDNYLKKRFGNDWNKDYVKDWKNRVLNYENNKKLYFWELIQNDTNLLKKTMPKSRL